MENWNNDLNDKLRADGFQHNFGFFGHGWGHCIVCHSSVEVQYPEENDKVCLGPMPKRLIFSGLEYDCCSQLTNEDWKKINAMKEKIIKDFNDQIESKNKDNN